MRWQRLALMFVFVLVVAPLSAQTGTTVGFYSQVPTVADAAALALITCSSTVNSEHERTDLDVLVKSACIDTGGGYAWTAIASAAAVNVSGFTDGSVTFVTSGALDEDNANLFWDDGNDRLGIGTLSPTENLTVDGNIRANSYIDLYNGSTDFTRIQREPGAAGLLKIFRQGSTTIEAVSIGGGNAELQIGSLQEGKLRVSGSEFRLGGGPGISLNLGAGNQTIDLVIDSASGDVKIGRGDLTVDCGAGDCTLRYIQGALGVVDQIDFGDFVIDAAGSVGIGTPTPGVNGAKAFFSCGSACAFDLDIGSDTSGWRISPGGDYRIFRGFGFSALRFSIDGITGITSILSGLIVTGGFLSGGIQTITLPAAATTFIATTNMVILTGDGGANTLATITGAPAGTTLKILCTDGLVTITDDNTHAADSVDLSAAFTCADDTTLTLSNYDGVSWYEDSRSIN